MLSNESVAALVIFLQLKASGRADGFEYNNLGAYSAHNPCVAALISAGLIKVNKAGAMQVERAAALAALATLPYRRVALCNASGLFAPAAAAAAE